MKCCTKCKIEKELSEFYKHKRYKDGYIAYCKSCGDEMVDKWREKNPDKHKEYQNEYQKKWQQKNPEKYKKYQDEYQKKYNKENREKRREIERRYALKKRIKNQNAWVYLKDYPLL